jgi:hypothetical protein
MADIAHVTRQARGKVRRFLQVQFRPQEVEALLAHRQGECDRCGDCCKILFPCPFLTKDSSGETLCRIYQYRFEQCRRYPIQPRDLHEVTRCSYTFAHADSPVLASEPPKTDIQGSPAAV